MEVFKPSKGLGYLTILGITIFVDILLFGVGFFASTYELLTLIKLVFLVFNLYQLFYVMLFFTLKFKVDDINLYASGNFGLKKVIIPYEEIERYYTSAGTIKGVKLSGYGSNGFALGRTVLDKIGTTYMFVTSNKEIIFLKTKSGNYAISPENSGKVKALLDEKGVVYGEWEYKPSKDMGIYKEKKFLIMLLIASTIIIVLTLNPFILYLRGKLPVIMPLSFDTNFLPVKMGTGKQFAFKQMTYGVLNMGVLFCMYYAAYFCAKYDKKIAYRFIYIAILISMVFLFMQYRILINFR